MTVQTMAITVVLLSLNISYLIVLSKYLSKSERYSDSFPNREQQIIWRVLPIVLSVINIIALIFAGTVNTTRLVAALLFLLVGGRPFIRAIVWAKSSRSMWRTYVLEEEIPVAIGTMICILLLDYMFFTSIAGPVFG